MRGAEFCLELKVARWLFSPGPRSLVRSPRPGQEKRPAPERSGGGGKVGTRFRGNESDAGME